MKSHADVPQAASKKMLPKPTPWQNLYRLQDIF